MAERGVWRDFLRDMDLLSRRGFVCVKPSVYMSWADSRIQIVTWNIDLMVQVLEKPSRYMQEEKSIVYD